MPTAPVLAQSRRGGVARVVHGWLRLGKRQNRTLRVDLWGRSAEEWAFRSARMVLVRSQSEQLSRGGFVALGLLSLSR